MSASSSDAATAAELRVRLDAGSRQAETLSLLMEREVAQMAAMERRAAVVVDDWSVLESARAIMDAPKDASDDGESKAAHTVPHVNSDDRNRVATAITDYEAAVEAADWESLPHTKLICGIPLVVFQVEVAPSDQGVDAAAGQPETVARKLDTSAATADPDALHVVVVDDAADKDDASAAAAEEELDERLDSDAKIDQVGQFREAAEASQEQLRVLSELLEHEQSSIASLKRLLADVDPEFAREQPHHRRYNASASRKAAPYVLDGTRTEGDSTTADLSRMHSTNEAHLPAVQRALRLVGTARTRDSSNVFGDRWREATKIAESLRSQFVARSAAHAAHVANDDDEEGAKDASQVCKEIEKVSDVKTAKQLLEVTEELEFAIRAAAGLKAKRRHAISGGRARSMAASSRQSSVGAGDAILAHSAARAAGAGGDGQSAHEDDEANDDDDDDDDVSSGAVIDELQTENGALKVRIAELEERAADAEAQAKAAAADAATAREDATAAQRERDELNEKLDEVERFLAESREAIEAIQQEQRLTEEAHKHALADADAAHDETKAELAKANARLKNLQGIEDSVAKWRETEKELSRVAESATDAHYAMRSELDATNVKLSTIEVRAARDQLIAKEARARLADTVDEFGEVKRDSRASLDACAADNAALREAIERAKMEHADELEQQREAAADATAAQMEEITRLQDDLADTQQRLEGAEARLAAIRKARMDKRFGSPTSAYSRSRARGASIDNESFRSASTAGPASPMAGDLLHAASMPAFHSARRTSASPRTANLSYFAASPRRTSNVAEMNESARAPAAAEGNTATSSPEPRTSSATMLWPADSENGTDEPEPSRVPDMVLDHARTAALLRQWEFEQKNRPRV